MSSTILTQTELDSYLSGLDLNDPVTLRILSSLQLLSPRFYNDILYYLVMGKIDLNFLSSVSINNASIQNIINALNSEGNTALASRRYYENYIKNHISWQELYLNTVNLSLSNSRISSKSILPLFFLDVTGVTQDYYSSLSSIKSVYLVKLEEFFKSNNWIITKTILEQRGYTYLLNIMTRELKSFFFQTSDLTYIATCDFKNSLLGFTLRNLQGFMWHSDFLNNLNYVLEYMTLKNNTDYAKDGVEGVIYGMSLPYNQWDSLKEKETFSDFYQTLGKLSLLRCGMTKFYGNYAFTSSAIGVEDARMSEVKYVLDLIKDTVQSFFSSLNAVKYKVQ